MKTPNDTKGAMGKALFLVAFGFTLVIPTIFGIFGLVSEMGLSLLGGLLCMAFTNLDKFSEFKGAGFYAKMKEAINEANASIETVREVALSTASVALHVAAAFGRWGGGTGTLERIKMRDRLRESLCKIGTSDEAIGVAEANFDSWILRDHVHKVFGSSREFPKNDPDIQDMLRYSPGRIVTSGDVEEVLKKHGIESEKVSEAMDDLRYYEKHRELRRPDVWN